MPRGMESVVRPRRHSHFNAANMKPIDRRREVIAIFARGLTRIDPASEANSRNLQNRPCFSGRNAAQCDSNAPEQREGEIDEVTQ